MIVHRLALLVASKSVVRARYRDIRLRSLIAEKLHLYRRVRRNTLGFCDLGAFRGRLRQFSGLRSRILSTQLLVADENITFSVPLSELFGFFLFSLFVLFFLCLLVLSTPEVKARTKPRQPQYLRTARTAEQPAIGPAQSSKVHAVVISCRPDSRVRQRNPADKTKYCRGPPSTHTYFVCPYFLFCWSSTSITMLLARRACPLVALWTHLACASNSATLLRVADAVIKSSCRHFGFGVLSSWSPNRS